jgi:hypothetical protein
VTAVSNPQWPAYRLGEIVGRLPPTARSKYRSIVAEIDDLHALIGTANERRKQLEMVEYDIESVLGRLDEKDTEARSNLAEEAKHARAELTKADTERAKRAARRGNLEQTLSQLQNWLGQWGGTGAPYVAAVIDAPVAKGETASVALLRIRAEISNVDTELARTKSAPPSRDEIVQTLRDEVQRKINAGTPRVIVDAGAVKVEWPDDSRFAQYAAGGSASNLWCWLNPDSVFKQLMSGIEGVDGLSKPEREAKLAELAARKVQLELQEEAAVVLAQAEGHEVHRRAAASPLAILGLMPASAPQVQAAE